MLGSLEARELGGRRSPRRFQEVLGRPPGDHQEDPRRRPGGPGRPPGGFPEALRPKIPPRSPRRPPGNRQEGAKKSPRCPQEAPRRPQERRKKWPRGPQERPSNPQERPNAAPGANTTKSMSLVTFSTKFMLFHWFGVSKMAENWPPNGPRRKKIAQETPRESR